MNVAPQPPAIVRAAGQSASSSDQLSEAGVIGLAARRGLTYPQTIWLALLARQNNGFSMVEFEKFVDDLPHHYAEVAQIQQWLDSRPPFSTVRDAIAAFSARDAGPPHLRTFSYAFIPETDKYLPYHPSGQVTDPTAKQQQLAQEAAAAQSTAQQAAAREAARGPSAEQVIGTAIGQGVDAANNLIREANATRRAEIEAEARVALAEIAARNGGAIPQSGQDAQTAAMLQLLAQQIAAQNQNTGPSPGRIALYVGGGLLVTAAVGGIIWAASRR